MPKNSNEKCLTSSVSLLFTGRGIRFLWMILGLLLALLPLGCKSPTSLRKTVKHPTTQQSVPRMTLSKLEKGVKDNPQDGKLWFLLGKAYYRERKFEKAARSFQRAILLNIAHEQRKEAYDKQAWSYYKMGKYNSAIQIFEVAASQYPNWPSPVAGKACALRQKGHYSEALKHFEQVLTKSPKHLMALDNRGWTYYQMKDYQNALNDFQRAEVLAHKKPFWLSNVLSGQGWCYYMLGDFRMALKKFDKALRVAPVEYSYGIWDASRGMAFTKAALGEFETSYELIEKASQAMQYDSRRDLALLYYAAGDKEKTWHYLGGSGYIGIVVSFATINGRDHILVTDVAKGGPAQKAGLLPQDIIVRVGGVRIEEFSSFHKEIRSAKPGSKLHVVVWRDGKEKKLKIIVEQADSLLQNDPLLAPIFKNSSATPFMY